MDKVRGRFRRDLQQLTFLGLMVAAVLLADVSTAFGECEGDPDATTCHSSGCGMHCCPQGYMCDGQCGCFKLDDGCGGGGGGGDSSSGCTEDTYRCGDNYCVPDGTLCCASVGSPDKYCPAGTVCTTDGNCREANSGGGAVECSGSRAPTEASCGGDSCSCADSCYSNSDCASGCCARGYCSPPCVCDYGSLDIGCDGVTDEAGDQDAPEFDSPYGDSSCSTSPGSPPQRQLSSRSRWGCSGFCGESDTTILR